MELWENWFLQGLKNFSLFIDEEKLNKFNEYLSLIVFYNQKFNLTGEKSKEDIAIKQFLDSLIPIYYIKEKKISFKIFEKCVDIGTGAGIPGIPIKIFLENLSLYLIESNKKRANFLEEVREKLSLEKVFILNGRGEELIKKEDLKTVLRESFTATFSRWVLKIPGIFELTAPFTQIQGKIFLWKGVDEIDLIEKNASFLYELGLEIEDIFKYELPYYKSERILLVLRKTRETPQKFPRSFKRIKSL